MFAEHLLNNIDREDVPIIDVFQNIAENVSKDSRGKQQPFSMNGLHQYDQVCLYTMPDGTFKTFLYRIGLSCCVLFLYRTKNQRLQRED